MNIHSNNTIIPITAIEIATADGKLDPVDTSTLLIVLYEGIKVASTDGSSVGNKVGNREIVGIFVGDVVGVRVGDDEGVMVGLLEG